MIVTYIVIGIVTFILYIKWRQTYWHRKGVPGPEPEFFFGHFREVVLKKISPGESLLKRYQELRKLNLKYAGTYVFWQPTLLLMDPELIKQVVQKDFNYFMDRGIYHHSKDILTMNLVNLEGEKWRELRGKLTPTFTSGKMKMMFETLLEKTEGLEKLAASYAAKKEPFAIKDVLCRFTTDIIASCAFGIDCNSLEDPDNIFRKYGKKVFEPNVARFWLTGIVPWKLLGYLGFKLAGYEVTNFFTNIVKETIKTREANEIFRKDFMHLLLQLKNQGVTSDSAKVKGELNTKENQLLSEDDIIAQCFIFFLAGFETSSSTMTFALLELGQNLDVQEKLRQEINKVLDKHNGKITYEAVMEMHYLEKVINETLRKFPPVAALPRTCTKEYTIPGTNLVIEKGTRIQIPTWGIHRDPEYYPNPEVFDPERFSEKNKASRPDFTFLPFGEGPRICIGLRFGMLESKVGLITLIRNFKFTLSKKTALPIQMATGGGLIISVKGEVWLDATKI
nr:cytochrome P450 6BW27 [Pagiophloeus tsushimanus]